MGKCQVGAMLGMPWKDYVTTDGSALLKGWKWEGGTEEAVALDQTMWNEGTREKITWMEVKQVVWKTGWKQNLGTQKPKLMRWIISRKD